MAGNGPDITLHIGAELPQSENTIRADLRSAFQNNPCKIALSANRTATKSNVLTDLRAMFSAQNPCRISFGVTNASLRSIRSEIEQHLAQNRIQLPLHIQRFGVDPDELRREYADLSRSIGSLTIDTTPYMRRLQEVGRRQRELLRLDPNTDDFTRALNRYMSYVQRLRDSINGITNNPPGGGNNGGNNNGGNNGGGGGGGNNPITDSVAFRNMQANVAEARRQLNLMNGDTQQLATILNYVDDMMEAALNSQGLQEARRYWDEARVAMQTYRTEMSTFQTGGTDLKKSFDLSRQVGDSTRRFGELERAFNSLQNPADELQQAFGELRTAQLELEQFSPDMDNAWVQQQLREVQRLRAEYERLLRSYGAGTPTTVDSFIGSKQYLNRTNVVTNMVETLQSLRQGANETAEFDYAIQQLTDHLEALGQASTIEAVNEELRRGDEIIQSIARHIRDTQDERKLSNVQSNIRAEASNFEAYLYELKPKAFDVLGTQIASIRNLFRDVPTDLGAAQERLDQITAATKEFKAICKQTGYESGNAIEFITRKMKEYGTYLVSSLLTDGLYRAFSKVIENVKTLDDALVNIRMVTGDNVAAARELLLVYNDIAKELGASTVDVSESAVEWLRQGYSEQATNELIKDSMVLSKVGFMDNAAAAQALTAAMKGYGVAAADAMTIVDKFTKVDQLAATSAGNLATALSKTAANAKVAGLELDEVIGYLAVVNETLQEDAESTGGKMRLVA